MCALASSFYGVLFTYVPLKQAWHHCFSLFHFHFAEEEFRLTYLNPLLSQWTLRQPMKPASPARSPAPDSWDWRDHGAVSPVKNQVRNVSLKLLWSVIPNMFPQICVCMSYRVCVDPAGHFPWQETSKASGSWNTGNCCPCLNKVRVVILNTNTPSHTRTFTW